MNRGTSESEPFIMALSDFDQCNGWTQGNGRCRLAKMEGGLPTCFIHRDYYTDWWIRNPPIPNSEWIRAQIDMHDTLDQHFFQLRVRRVELDADTQERIATEVLAGPRGMRAYTKYYKRLLTLPHFNPMLCPRLAEEYFTSMLEDFLYYKFFMRSATDRVLYAETLFKEIFACQHIEAAWIFRQVGVVLASLLKSPNAEEYYNGSSSSEVIRRTWWSFLRVGRLWEIGLCGRVARDVLNWIRVGDWSKSLQESTGVSAKERAVVAGLLEEELWALWAPLAKERAAIIKEELYYFTSHPAWWFTRCMDIEEQRDFDDTLEQLWANGVTVSGPFYLRDSVAAAEPRKKLKTGFWRELDADATDN
jgi:hypothetical protein